MKTKMFVVSIILVLAFLATTAFTPAAFLQPVAGKETSAFIATGDGVADVRGNLQLRARGSGVLWVHDEAGDASIIVTGKGKKIDLGNGWTEFIGYNGEAAIKGSKVTVSLNGVNIRFEVSGTGGFILRGRGSYHKSRFFGSWPATGKF